MLLNIEDAARELGLGAATVRRLIESGDLPVVRIRRRILLHPDAVALFIRRHVVAGPNRARPRRPTSTYRNSDPPPADRAGRQAAAPRPGGR